MKHAGEQIAAGLPKQGQVQVDWYELHFWVIFELFFCKKKYLLVGASSMLWVDGWVSQWVSQSVSQSVRDVCISHQSGWIYYEQPIAFLVVKVNPDSDTVQNGHILSSIKEEEVPGIHILGLLRHFLWVRLRILVMDKMSLEVWNRTWASSMQMKRDTFIFSCKGNLILLFFTKSKFNKRSRIIASSS